MCGARTKDEETEVEGAQMQTIRTFYHRYEYMLERYLFPVLLVLYPLLRIRQGIDVTDTTYSLANFAYFGEMEGTWMTATFLANALGSLLMKLPYGDTLCGIYFYTSLLPAATALLGYETLKKEMPAPAVFLGEAAALGLCWCPVTILYNYLTYLLMTGGMLLLYRGICLSGEGEMQRKRQIACYVGAGVLLGINVSVRMPNIAQAAFIIGLWYAAGIDWRGKKRGENGKGEKQGDICRREAWKRLWMDTLWCLAGYVSGLGVMLAVISVRYGFSAYPEMVTNLFAMTEKAVDYKPSAMLSGMFGDYARGLFWLLFAGVCMLAGAVLFRLQERSRLCYGRQLGMAAYTGVLLLLLRFYWGKGVFSFRYYEYSSMYYPAVLLLLVGICLAVLAALSPARSRERRILSVLLLVQIFVTPLGSNNDLYPILNALFLVLPFTFGELWERGKKMEAGRRVVLMLPAGLLCLFVLVQSIGFHLCFAFQDGMDGEKRSMQIETPAKARGVYTTERNGALLEELALCAEELELAGREAIFYGEIPGLGYFLDMPSALSTFWPDLDSYRMQEFERDMEEVEQSAAQGGRLPVVFLAAADEAYLSGDAEKVSLLGADKEKLSQDQKLEELKEFLEENQYEEVFCNAAYAVYIAPEQE